MLGRADHRELVHLHRWRMTCPLVMIENEQARPMKAFPRTSLVRASPPLTSPAVRLLVRLLLLFLFSSLAFTPSAFCSSKVPTDPWRLSSTATPTPGPGAPGFNASASLLVHDTYRPCQTRRHRDCLLAQVPPVWSEWSDQRSAQKGACASLFPEERPRCGGKVRSISKSFWGPWKVGQRNRRKGKGARRWLSRPSAMPGRR